MLKPTIGDYIGALVNPLGVFRSLGEIEVETDIYGVPDFRAGNSAAIFTYSVPGGGRRFLKCYIRSNPYLRVVYDYIERRRPALLPDVRLLREEVYVHTLSGGAGWFDIVEGEWTEGETLDVAVSRAVRSGDGCRLEELALAFDGLCAELATQEWGHGDLKPENIVVGAGSRLTIIDCDAMWLPELAGRPAAELGTPPWRDPSRTAGLFDKRIDDHPARAISKILHDIACEPEFRKKFISLEVLFIQNNSLFL
ncbi:MAG: hypothetical protein LBR57_00955 [Alistipes sp.]|jgi:hypothetical protein|nr:hypothetical protein [Alistipes sp.]